MHGITVCHPISILGVLLVFGGWDTQEEILSMYSILHIGFRGSGCLVVQQSRII